MDISCLCSASRALKLGQAAGFVFKRGEHPVLIGKDTRRSNYMTESALVAGFTSVGMNVLLTGPTPKPAVAMLAASMRTALGVMVSSPSEGNQTGITLFGPDGNGISGDAKAQYEALAEENLTQRLAKITDFGRAWRIEGAENRYAEYVKRSIPQGIEFAGLRVVVDCAHGATYKSAPLVLAELGADVVPVGVEPSGLNIGHDCGLAFPETLSHKMWERRADAGLVFNESGDELLFMDESRRAIKLLTLCTALETHREELGGPPAEDPFIVALQTLVLMKRLGKKASEIIGPT